MHKIFYSIIITLSLILAFAISPALAQVPDDCGIPDDTLANIRLMLTAEDNGMFFEIWTSEELACACIELYYNDPLDADFHDRVITGAVVLLGMTEDPRAVPVLIDAIDTHPPQALYNLGNFSTIDALNALTAHIRDENYEARENAAEGLRNMLSPSESAMEDGWLEALEAALAEVGDWMLQEPEASITDYFLDAHANLENLIDSATSSAAGTE